MRKILFVMMLFMGIYLVIPVQKPKVLEKPLIKQWEEKILPKEITQEEANNSITSGELKEFVSYFASDECAGRYPGTAGWQKAKDRAVKEFESYGLQKVNGSYLQPFKVNNIETENIVGYLEGKNKDKFIVIGGHLDHLGKRGNRTYYGADDNASGASTVLELAEAFSSIKSKLNHTFVFILFSGEEEGLVGSRYYVKHPLFPLSNTITMFNFDMVSRLNGKNQLSCSGGASKDFLNNSLDKFDDKYHIHAITTKRVGGGSDHKSFADVGVPVVFFFTGTHREYHTPQDTPEKCDFAGMEKIGRFAFDALCEVDKVN